MMTMTLFSLRLSGWKSVTHGNWKEENDDDDGNVCVCVCMFIAAAAVSWNMFSR